MGRKDKRIPPMLGDTSEALPAPIAVAIAEHFGITLDRMTGFVVGVEHDGTGNFSTTWTATLGRWTLDGYVRELAKQIEEKMQEGQA